MIQAELNYGILGQRAPEWHVNRWLNLPDGQHDLDLSDFEEKIVFVYCFQYWCPDCHTVGFPTLNAVYQHFRHHPDVAFVAIQTVYEGFHVNSMEGAQQALDKHGLAFPVGHDPGLDNTLSEMIKNYQVEQTPWNIIIDQDRLVRHSAGDASPETLIWLIDELLANKRQGQQSS